MTRFIFNSTASAALLIGLATMTSCSESEVLTASEADDAQTMSLAIKGGPAKAQATAGSSSDSDSDALRIFQFGKEGLLRRSVVSAYDPQDIALVKGATRSLYCVQGMDIVAAEGISEGEFALMKVTSPDDADSAPLFYSGWSVITAQQRNCELTMTRSVARIDLDAREAAMDITEVTVEDAPAASYVFVTDAGKLDAPTTTYTHTCFGAPQGVEKGIFTLFESGKEVHVTVHGKVDGIETSVQAFIETVDRGKVYTLRVYEKNAMVNASFIVADWEDGGLLDATTDMANGLHIDMANSVIPAGVSVDCVRNIVDVPSTGAEGMKLAFLSDLRVDIDSIHFIGERIEVDSIKEKHVSIAAGKPSNTPAGVMTAIDVKVAPQMKGRPGYEIKMELSKPNMNVSCDALTIRVAESPYQLHTVMMAGAEWMSFNATTPDLSDQIYAEPGMTVEEYYQQHWISTIGLFFQYGRQLGWNPWDRAIPDFNTLAPDTPWATQECMPVPVGYHVATADEWTSLIPAGVSFPSTYTAGNGETITATVVELPGLLDDAPCTAANNAKLRKRYIRFESKDTGNVLIFPVCGLKGATQDLYPGAGKGLDSRAVYWNSSERSIWLINLITTEDGQLGANPMSDRWNINGFIAVRGVKNKH